MTKQQQRVLRAARSLVACWGREGLARRRFPYGGKLVDEREAEKALTMAVEELRGAEP